MEIRSPSTARLARIICLVSIVRLVRLSEAAKGQELLASSISHRLSRIVRLLLHLFCSVYCSVCYSVSCMTAERLLLLCLDLSVFVEESGGDKNR